MHKNNVGEDSLKTTTNTTWKKQKLDASWRRVFVYYDYL